MTVDRIWYVLGKKLSGEASEEELVELARLLQTHPELHYPVQNITDLWKLGKPVNEYEVRQALKNHLLRLEEQSNKLVENEGASQIYPPAKGRTIKKYWFLSGIAATVIVFMSYLIFLISGKPSAQLNNQALTSLKKEDLQKKRNTVSTKTGSQSKVVLPDGSTVWLNAGSTIIYDKYFDKNIREVSLNGEAYFDVVKDTSRPFIIHTQKINIKVLGTAFNVKSYANDTHSETSLIDGSIEVTMKDHPQEKIIMKPSQKLMIMNDAVTLTPAKTDAGQKPAVVLEKINLIPSDGAVVETSWMDNRFVFRDKKFVDLAHEMERKYGVSFRFENDKEQQLMFSGNFKNETVDQVLKALQLANYFTYSIENNVIVITP